MGVKGRPGSEGLPLATDVNRDTRHTEICGAGLRSDGVRSECGCWECEGRASLFNPKDAGKAAWGRAL